MTYRKAWGVFMITVALVFPLIVLVFLFFAEVGFFMISFGALNKAFNKASAIANSSEPLVALQALLEGGQSHQTAPELVNNDEDFQYFVFKQNVSELYAGLWPELNNDDSLPCLSASGQVDIALFITSLPERFRVFLIALFALTRRHIFSGYLGQFCASDLDDCIVCSSFSNSPQVDCDTAPQLLYICEVERPSLLGLSFFWPGGENKLTFSNRQ